MNNSSLPTTQTRRLFPVWLRWTLMAVISWGIWAVLGKPIGSKLTATQILYLSSIGVLPVILALAPSFRQSLARPERRTLGIGLALGAGILSCTGNLAFYRVLDVGSKAATVVPLTALYPFVTVILAFVFLRERLNSIQWLGIVFSLLATWCFNNPESADPGMNSLWSGFRSPWLLSALVPIGLWGLSALLQKLATQYLPGEIVTFWFLLAYLPIALALAFREPLTQPVTAKVWILVIAIGLTFALGNYALLLAFACHGKASVISPLSGLYSLVSIPLAFFFLGERTGWRENLGILFSLIAVVGLAWESSSKDRANTTLVSK